MIHQAQLVFLYIHQHIQAFLHHYKHLALLLFPSLFMLLSNKKKLNMKNQIGKKSIPNMYETMKQKLSMSVGTVQRDGVQRIFTQLFDVKEEEKLLKVSQCNLSTTAGPIPGLLFVSSEKVAFCSQRTLTFKSASRELVRTPYKVIIPLRKIKRATQSENVNKPTQKYIEIFTVDNFDFWFMGFVDFQKTFKYLQQAISQF